jgi:hypothetical protein
MRRLQLPPAKARWTFDLAQLPVVCPCSVACSRHADESTRRRPPRGCNGGPLPCRPEHLWYLGEATPMQHTDVASSPEPRTDLQSEPSPSWLQVGKQQAQ